MDNGYCIYIKDFYADVVRFKTLSITSMIDTVPSYKILLENGLIDERNETELALHKEELEERVIELNKKMEKNRKWWNKSGLPSLKKAGLI